MTALFKVLSLSMCLRFPWTVYRFRGKQQQQQQSKKSLNLPKVQKPFTFVIDCINFTLSDVSIIILYQSVFRLYHGRWQRGVSAGGCRNNPDSFHMNPQLSISLAEADEVILALNQHTATDPKVIHAKWQASERKPLPRNVS